MILRKSLSIFLMMFVVSGCGLTATQKSSVQNFGTASSTASKVAADELVAMRDDTIAMNTHRIEWSGLNPTSPGLNNLDGKFKPEKLLIISKAINVLNAYGTALDALVKDTQKEELSKAATNLTTSINSLPESYIEITDDHKESIQNIIIEIGSMVVESQKKKAIKKIVNEYEKQINKITDLISDEFNYKPGNTLASSFLSTSSIAVMESSDNFKKCKTISCREKAMSNYNEANKCIEKTKIVLINVSNSMASLKKANADLIKKVNDDKYNEKDIENFLEAVKVLVESTKILANS